MCSNFIFLAAGQTFGCLPAKDMEKTFVTLSVRSSSKADLESKLDLNSREINQALKKAVVQKTNIPLSLKDVYVTIRQGGQETHLRLERSGSFWNEADMERLILPKEAADKLLTYGEALRKHHYGKIIPWEEAQPDSGHQLIVHKAAGKLGTYLDNVSPDVLAKSFVEAVHQQDPDLLREIFEGCSPKKLSSLFAK